MIYIKQNDRRPPASQTLKRGDTVVDLTEATGVTFKMREQGRKELKVNTAGMLISNDGEVRYNWQSGDTDTPGMFEVEWEVIWNDGTTETFPTLGYEPCIIHGDLDS